MVMALPIGLVYEGRVALATFVCAIVWWMTQPLPWAVSAMLPFLVFPAAGVMNIADTMRLYGQPIFFWIMGTVLMGYAIEKHGLARRFAITFLAMRGIGGKTHRLMFAYMLVVGVDLDVRVRRRDRGDDDSDRHVTREPCEGPGWRRRWKNQLRRVRDAGYFYASVAGGTATIMGVPHNAISVSLLEQFTGRQLGFFEWMRVGLPVFLALLVAFYAILWVLVRPEVRGSER